MKHGATSVICAAVAATPGSDVSDTNSRQQRCRQQRRLVAVPHGRASRS